MSLGLKKKRVSIHITDNAINILIGKRNKIIDSHTIPLSDGVCVDGTVKKTDTIIKKLREYIEVNARGIKKLSFVIRGSDIIIRHIEVPILKGEALDNAVNFEFQQFIPEINNYYTNYEIVHKNNTAEKKSYNILLVAVVKEKIDPLVKITEALNKELQVIDIASNSMARVLRESSLLNENESTVIFYISSDNSSISIIEDKTLKFERNLPFGIRNLLADNYEDVIKKNMSVQSKQLEEILNNNERMRVSFNNLISAVTNTIRYYNSDRNNKPVGSLILICEEIAIHNIEKNLTKYFSFPLISIKEPNDLDIKIKANNYFPRYVVNYGVLLRRGTNKLINLNPKHSSNDNVEDELDRKLVMTTSVIAITLALIITAFLAINRIISNDINNIKSELDRYSVVIETNKELIDSNKMLEEFIASLEQIKVNALDTSNTLAKLNTYIPKEIEFTTLLLNDNGNININGESTTYDAISVFLANLLGSDDFNKAKINYINPIEKTVANRLDNVNRVYDIKNIKQEIGKNPSDNKVTNEGNSAKNTKIYNFSITIEGVNLNGG